MTDGAAGLERRQTIHAADGQVHNDDTRLDEYKYANFSQIEGGNALPFLQSAQFTDINNDIDIDRKFSVATGKFPQLPERGIGSVVDPTDKVDSIKDKEEIEDYLELQVDGYLNTEDEIECSVRPRDALEDNQVNLIIPSTN